MINILLLMLSILCGTVIILYPMGEFHDWIENAPTSTKKEFRMFLVCVYVSLVMFVACIIAIRLQF